MTESNLIEGVGDEVTIVLGGLFVIITVVIAWLSTRVVETPFVTTIPNSENLFTASTENNTESTPQASPAESPSTSETPSSNEFEQPFSPQTLINEAESFENINIPNVEGISDENIPSTSSSQETNLRQRKSVENSNIESGHFLIRLKFLDERIKTIQVKSLDTIGEFRRKHFPAATAHRYRIIYRGQVFRDDSATLADCGIKPPAKSQENDDIPVIHCFLSAETANTDNANHIINTDDLNVGHFLRPIFGVIISILWYLSIYHTSLFTIPSLFCVVGLTCFYLVILVNQFL